MMQKTSRNIFSKATTLSIATMTSLILLSHSVFATPSEDAGTGASYIDNGATTTGTLEGVISKFIDALLFMIGVVSVIMIIVGGLRYILSQGDPQTAASARNTVFYAMIGVVVAVSAYGLIHFVLAELYAEPGTPSSLTIPAETDAEEEASTDQDSNIPKGVD